MELPQISFAEWRAMSDAEQRTAIRAGMIDYEDLPEHLRAEVDEMLANARPIPSSS